MGQRQQGQPTLFESIFVGSGPGADQRAELFLTVADWFLREEEVSIKVPVKGDLSQWIVRLCAKPIVVKAASPVGTSVQREMVGQSVNMLVDPRQEEEQRIAALMEGVSSADVERIFKALQKSDLSAFHAARNEVAERLVRPIAPTTITPDTIPAVFVLLSRMRAARALALCVICYKMHPLSLIARARQGDRRAVLDLVKVDKLFLHDRCTAAVIRDAQLRNDRAFLGQLARAVAYKPKLGWRRGCQLYLQVLFACRAQFPALSALHLRLDPEGKKFGSFAAFERFYERCRVDFLQLQKIGQHGSNSLKGANKTLRRG